MTQTKISALLHVRNHALQLGRALDSLCACDEVMVVDHGSTDDTVRVAHEHGARAIRGASRVDCGSYAQQATHDWVLCLLPEESLTEDLEATLFEFRMTTRSSTATAFNITIREQQGCQWQLLPAETRLVNRKQVRWSGALPEPQIQAETLQGYILRIPDATKDAS